MNNHTDVALAEKCGQLIGLLAILPDWEELDGMFEEDIKRRVAYINKRKIEIIHEITKHYESGESALVHEGRESVPHPTD
jgi:hypothetical protein